MIKLMITGNDTYWEADNGERIQVNLSSTGNKQRDKLIKTLWAAADRFEVLAERLKGDLRELSDFHDRLREQIDKTDKQKRSEYVAYMDIELGELNDQIPSIEYEIKRLRERQQRIRKYVSGLSMEPVGRE